MKRTFVISLPRTGTSSIALMAAQCGISSKHVSTNWHEDIKRFNFLSDTPFFCPKVISELVKTDECQFIYCKRNWESLYESWTRSKLSNNYAHFFRPDVELSPLQQFDKDFYLDALGGPLTNNNYREVFQRHTETVFDIVGNRPLLEYSFEAGWEPFCEFMGVDVPSQPLPHLNRYTMCDKVNRMIAECQTSLS